MSSEIKALAPEDLERYLQRGRAARSEAVAAFGRNLAARLRAVIASVVGGQRPDAAMKARAA